MTVRQMRLDSLPSTFCPESGSDQLAEYLVHDFGAAGQGRHDLVPIDELRRRGLVVPASSAIASTGTPRADSSDTNVCRISRGTHPVPSPASAVITRNIRRTL